jgi:hypothetical protein
LEPVVRRCEISAQRSPAPDLVPSEFKPTHTRVVSAGRATRGFKAHLLYDRSVTEVYAAIKRAVTAAGYAVVREENEGRDAELFLERDGLPTEVRLRAVRACPQYAVGDVDSGGEEHDG